MNRTIPVYGFFMSGEGYHLKNVILGQGRRMFMVTVGIVLNAFAVAAFCLPFNILVGGSTGMFVSHLLIESFTLFFLFFVI